MPTETTFKAFHFGADLRPHGGTWLAFSVTNGQMDVQYGRVDFLSGDRLNYWLSTEWGGFFWKIQ